MYAHSIVIALLNCMLMEDFQSKAKILRNNDIVIAACEWGGKRYSAGETWNPIVQPFGLQPCVTCTCYADSKVQCATSQCPKTSCRKPRILPGTCCPSCKAAAPDVGDQKSFHGCRHDGRYYQHGMTFATNRSAIRPTRRSQCVLCACVNTKILCYLKSCPPTRCKDKVIPSDDECCPVCKEDMDKLLRPDYWKATDNITQKLPQRTHSSFQNKTTSPDCLHGGNFKLNGTVWHPYFAHFGTMRCIICACVNGTIICRRVTCPLSSSLKCRKPRRRRGQCCPSCSTRSRSKNRGRGRRRKKHRKRKNLKKSGFKNPKRRKSRKRNMPNNTEPLTSVDVMLKDLCLPLRSDRLIFTSLSTNVFNASIDIIHKDLVFVYTFTLQRGLLAHVKTTKTRFSEFRKDYRISKIIGATDRKNHRVLAHRLNKHMRKCRLKQRRCKLRGILRILKKLRKRKLQYSPSCAALHVRGL